MNLKTLMKLGKLKDTIKHQSLSGSKLNAFHYHKHNSDIHENVKFLVYQHLIKKGFLVYTEVEFKNSLGKADIVFFDERGGGHILEIVNSEREESISEKIDKYPIEFTLDFIHCNKQIEEQLAW